MTRQKKEIIKKINWLWEMIVADEELGCGFAPAGFYEPVEKEINGLEEELAILRHYKSAEEMMFDTRGLQADIPF